MKWDRSSLLTLVYCLFTLLYTFYITGHQPAGHFSSSGHNGRAAGAWAHWAYYLEFLLTDGYVFFIGQGLILRSKNWGILLLIPLGLLLVTIIVGYLMVGILRFGGGTLLDRDDTDMILCSICWLMGSFYALKLIKTGKKKKSAR